MGSTGAAADQRSLTCLLTGTSSVGKVVSERCVRHHLCMIDDRSYLPTKVAAAMCEVCIDRFDST